jgi:hypothetical protein
MTLACLKVASLLALGCLAACKGNDAGGKATDSRGQAQAIASPTSAPSKPLASGQAGGSAAVPSRAACAGGGGTNPDALSAPFFPRTSGTFCIDPDDHVRAYGARAKGSMDEVCTQAFNGECEVYKRYGLTRVVFIRYVDANGPSSIEIYLSEFKDGEGAFGLFGKRVVADADPARQGAPRPLGAGAAGALGTGRAYVVRAAHLVELQYNNDQESEAELRASSERVLAPLASAIGELLPGPKELPPAVALLPSDKRVPAGLWSVNGQPLGIAGVGPAAFASYADGAKRWRGVLWIRSDAATASADLKALRAKSGALPAPTAGEDGVSLALVESKDAPKADYVFARKGAIVFGVGDETLAFDPTKKPEEQAALRLSLAEKGDRVKAMLGSLK